MLSMAMLQELSISVRYSQLYATYSFHWFQGMPNVVYCMNVVFIAPATSYSFFGHLLEICNTNMVTLFVHYHESYRNHVTATKFGAVLDMVTDRASTACLWCVLAGQYPDYAMAFQAMLALDILSHFARLFATMSGGSKSHKDVKPTGNIFLYYYYSKRWVLFILCMGHEVVFMLLYFLASLKELKMDPSGLAAQIALYALYINLPLCALKEWMNAVQFWQSMVDIVAIDMEERRAAGLEPASTASSKSAPAKAPKSPKAAAASPASPKSSGRRKKFAE